MPERTVKQTLASYRDPDGTLRYALAGETVDVGDDDVARFDEANGAPKSEDTPAPKRRAPRPKT